MAVGGAVVGALLVAVAVWIGFRAAAAVRHLHATRADADRIAAELTGGGSITADTAAYRRDATAAYDDTHDPVWGAFGWLPPLHTVRGATAALHDIGERVLPPIARVAPSVTPASLRVNGHTIDVGALSAAAPDLHRASVAMNAAVGQIAALPGGWFGPLTNARDELLSQASKLAGSVSDAADFARIGPGMLGANGPRSYFIGVENNAESRGTGGLVGGFVILRARNGSLHVMRHGTDAELLDRGAVARDVPRGFANVYGLFDATDSWRESNLSPNFPDVGSVWAQMWDSQHHQTIDGALAVDPMALGRLLDVTGPIRDPVLGGTVNGSQITPLLLQREYQIFGPDQSSERKAYLTTLATAVIRELLSGAGDPVGLAHALATSAGTGDLQAFSAHTAEERVLLRTPLGGAVPSTRAPFASLTLDNAGGTKLDYYLQRSFSYLGSSCSDGARRTTISAALTNNAPPRGLPAYVRLQPAISNRAVERFANDQLLVFLDVTRGARLTRLTVNGRTVSAFSGVADNGHPVYELPVTIPPGQTRTITAYLDEPAAAGVATTKVQPLAIPQTTQISVPSCS